MKFSSGVIITFLVGLTSSAQASPQYQLIDLGALPSAMGYSVNSSGQVTGQATVSGQTRAFLYSNGTMQNLGTLGGDTSVGYSINDAGQVVGYSYAAFGGARAFMYSNNSLIDLSPSIGGDYSIAYGLNNGGQIIGDRGIEYRPDIQKEISHGFLYSNGSLQDLGTLGGLNSTARGINSLGQVVGSSQLNPLNFSDVFHGFIYSNGVMQDIGSLGGSANAVAINDSGNVAGYSTLTESGTTMHAFVYSGGNMVDISTLSSNESRAFSINNSGTAVGFFVNDLFTQRAFIYDGNSSVDLNSLVDSSAAGWTLRQATDINDSGIITGFGDKGSQRHAFLLVPSTVPEPASMFALTLGGVGLLLRRKRG